MCPNEIEETFALGFGICLFLAILAGIGWLIWTFLVPAAWIFGTVLFIYLVGLGGRALDKKLNEVSK